MTSYVIAGAGAAGLYTAYRLLSGNVLETGDTVQLIEWSESHVGGRIHTYNFEGGDANGQYVEAGGMRFSTDPNFHKNSIQSGHVVLQNLIWEMNLQDSVVEFVMSSPNRLYYLRGVNFYEQNIPSTSLPYQFDANFKTKNYDQMNAESIFGAVAENFTQTTTSWTRAEWCNYFAIGTVPAQAATATFPAGFPVRDIGYWNLLYDQLGDEGFDYVTDANGFASNTINWNSADAMQNNTEFGDNSGYSRIQGGYSLLFDALAEQIAELAQDRQTAAPFIFGTQLAGFECQPNGQFALSLVDSNGPFEMVCDQLFLAMPRRSLEIVAAGSSADNPLNQEAVKLYIESSLNQPAFKVALLFDDPWWSDPTISSFTPVLTDGAGGPTMTDLPLRQIYYFGNDATGATGGGPYVLLASYDDMQFESFWQELEINGDRTVPGSMDYQPLNGPTVIEDLNGPMVNMLLNQLALVHGADVANIPAPTQAIFQDWGRNPYGAGYHGWAAHYNICEVMQAMLKPATILGDDAMNLYIVGACYSIDQAWVEGALCTAEQVMQQYFGMAPFRNVPEGYTLICTLSDQNAQTAQAARSKGDTEPAGT